jgi:hypothetical protein
LDLREEMYKGHSEIIETCLEYRLRDDEICPNGYSKLVFGDSMYRLADIALQVIVIREPGNQRLCNGSFTLGPNPVDTAYVVGH